MYKTIIMPVDVFEMEFSVANRFVAQFQIGRAHV